VVVILILVNGKGDGRTTSPRNQKLVPFLLQTGMKTHVITGTIVRLTRESQLNISHEPTNSHRNKTRAEEQFTMAKRRVVCVTTSLPGTALSAGGGSLTTLCPTTGAVQSTLRVSGDGGQQKLIGLSSLSLLSSPASSGRPLAIAFGSNTANAQDSYAFLISIGGHNSSVHWKCRLPEPQLILSASPCGNYVVGGGASGTLFVWKALEGKLLNSFMAHYRSITVLEWCNGFLVTGGADGMVHAFALSHLVQSPTPNSASGGRTSRMIRTWNQHHVSITAIESLSGGRFASAAQDGRVHISELCSGTVLATFSYDAPIRCMTHSASHRCLFLGGKDGVLRVLDLDEYAIRRTMQLGGTVVAAARTPQCKSEVVFGIPPETSTYQSELRGHDCAITSVHVVSDALLVSGDESGFLRMWDLRARVCIRVVNPWTVTASGAKVGTTNPSHPVTSIRVVELSDRGEDDSSLHKEWLQRITPLQKFLDTTLTTFPVFIRPNRTAECEAYWHSSTRILDVKESLRKRRLAREQVEQVRSTTAVVNSSIDPDDGANATIRRLQDDLAQAQSTIQRWETVNNKLLTQLQNTKE
jgi:WD40 repeat protein